MKTNSELHPHEEEIRAPRSNSLTNSSLSDFPFQLLPNAVYPLPQVEKGLAWQERFVDDLKEKPHFRIFIPCFTGDELALAQTLESLAIQSARNFDLFICSNYLSQDEIQELSKRVLSLGLTFRVSIGAEASCASPTFLASNAASTQDMHEADFYLVLHPGDLLHPCALYVLSKELGRVSARVEFIHFNELIVGPGAKTNLEFWRKGPLDEMSLLSTNTIGRGLAVSALVFGCLCREGLFSQLGKAVVGDWAQWLFVLKVWEIVKASREGDSGDTDSSSDARLFIPLSLYVSRASRVWAGDKSGDLPEEIRSLIQRSAKRFGVDVEKIEHAETGPTLAVHTVPRDAKVEIQVVIPFKNHAQMTCRCLWFLAMQDCAADLEIVLLDNGSSEWELQKIEKYLATYPLREQLKLVKAPGYFNFARINNLGASLSESPLLLLLNNDVELRQPHAVSALRRWALCEGVGAVGGMLRYENGHVQTSGINFAAVRPANISSKLQFNHVCRQVNAVSCAFAMFRREAYIQAGGLDEYLCPNGFGDALFGKVLSDFGWKVIYCPLAEAYHLESVSRGAIPEELEFWELEKSGVPVASQFADFRAVWQPEIIQLTTGSESAFLKLAHQISQRRKLLLVADKLSYLVISAAKLVRGVLSRRKS